METMFLMSFLMNAVQQSFKAQLSRARYRHVVPCVLGFPTMYVCIYNDPFASSKMFDTFQVFPGRSFKNAGFVEVSIVFWYTPNRAHSRYSKHFQVVVSKMLVLLKFSWFSMFSGTLQTEHIPGIPNISRS